MSDIKSPYLVNLYKQYYHFRRVEIWHLQAHLQTQVAPCDLWVFSKYGGRWVILQEAHVADIGNTLTKTQKSIYFWEILSYTSCTFLIKNSFSQLTTGSDSLLGTINHKVSKRHVSKYSAKYYMHNTACVVNHCSFSWGRKAAIS